MPPAGALGFCNGMAGNLFVQGSSALNDFSKADDQAEAVATAELANPNIMLKGSDPACRELYRRLKCTQTIPTCPNAVKVCKSVCQAIWDVCKVNVLHAPLFDCSSQDFSNTVADAFGPCPAYTPADSPISSDWIMISFPSGDLPGDLVDQVRRWAAKVVPGVVASDVKVGVALQTKIGEAQPTKKAFFYYNELDMHNKLKNEALTLQNPQDVVATATGLERLEIAAQLTASLQLTELDSGNTSAASQALPGALAAGGAVVLIVVGVAIWDRKFRKRAQPQEDRSTANLVARA
eukprot:Colp12_sorted_trinity150504_noHs@19289